MQLDKKTNLQSIKSSPFDNLSKKSKQFQSTHHHQLVKTPYQKLKSYAAQSFQRMNFNKSLNQNRSCDLSLLSMVSKHSKDNSKGRIISPNTLWYFNELNRKYTLLKKDSLIIKLNYSQSAKLISNNPVKNNFYIEDYKFSRMKSNQNYCKFPSKNKASIPQFKSSHSINDKKILKTINSKLRVICFKHTSKLI